MTFNEGYDRDFCLTNQITVIVTSESITANVQKWFTEQHENSRLSRYSLAVAIMPEFAIIHLFSSSSCH